MSLRDKIEDGETGTKLLFTSWPVYVTRDYENFRVSYEMPGFGVLAIIFLAWTNAIGWGIYGLVELIGKVV